jgi:cob(I)alamin adenosyltransferase
MLAYLNRLSDLLFAMARLADKRAGVTEVKWKAGRTERGDRERPQSDG